MKERYYSLDVFRGATVALMILVNNPGNWGNIYTPFEHAEWHGCTPTDLVFPFFLFAVGNALAFVMPRMQENGTAYFLKKVLTRSFLIFFIGLFLNWFPFVMWKDDKLIFKVWENIRLLNVLQRIALCYLFSSLLIYFFKPKVTLLISAAILLSYWAMCYFLGASGDPYSMSGYFGTAVDKAVLGESHMYQLEPFTVNGVSHPFDPEGITSTLPAIVQVVFGYFAGRYIRRQGKTWEMLSHLFIAGAVLCCIGYWWDMAFPINKKIWTSSYVVYTTGLALIVIGVLIYLLEFRNARGAWSSFCDAFGKNPLFIYWLSFFLSRLQGLMRWTDHTENHGKPVYLTPFSWFYTYVCKPVSENLKTGSMLYAICLVLLFWAIAYWLQRKKVYIKV